MDDDNIISFDEAKKKLDSENNSEKALVETIVSLENAKRRIENSLFRQAKKYFGDGFLGYYFEDDLLYIIVEEEGRVMPLAFIYDLEGNKVDVEDTSTDN